MALLRITGLPQAPLDAAAAFHAEWLPRLRADLAAQEDESTVLVFPPADHSHRGWRLAAVQELARARAPRRVNALACDSEEGLVAALGLLDNCQGVTGQLLAIDAAGMIEPQS
ncbi:Rossmann fold domain-containing protein [Novosphingobium sp.]|uniref:Rossmann fold domain-containing protein n=1 Tax=Novosphingobium sp. TaxID=1874826 RepID=UPI0025CC8430|nr:hypothetical protein [Novosphingobium sp.]MCC6924491.1 hypothetical protein [Novosphingobium sp.]